LRPRSGVLSSARNRSGKKLGHQKDFADIPAILNEMMRLRRFIELEGAGDFWLDDAFRPQIQQLLGPTALAVEFSPQMAEIDAEHAFVGIHQRQRIELQPRNADKRSQHPHQAALLAAYGRRKTEHAEPARRCESAITFLPRLAANSIKNKFNAAAIGDLTDPGFKVLRSVIDQVIDAERAQLGVLGRRRGADDARTDMFGDLGGGNADAAAGRM